MTKRSLKDELAAIEGVVLAVFSVEAKKETLALGKLKSEYDARAQTLREIRRKGEEAREARPGLAASLLPFLKRRHSRQQQLLLGQMHKRDEFLSRRLEEIRQKAETRRARLPVYKQNLTWLRQRISYLNENAGRADQKLHRLVLGLRKDLLGLQSSKELRKGQVIISILERHLAPIDEWIYASISASSAPAVAPLRVPEVAKPSSLTPLGDRVFLPINPALRKTMPKGYLKTDKGAGRLSPYYLEWNANADWAGPFERFLPEAFQKHRKSYDFTEIPGSARRQNLWSVFDEASWGFIREAVRMATGYRCKVCGSVGGRLIDTVFEDEKHKAKSVDCHEVWDWEILDEDQSIGVQKLREILVLCTDCHMMWHEEFAVSKAERHGKDGEQVRTFLRDRMAEVSGLDPAEVEARVAAGRDQLARRSEVDTWVMDLSYIQMQSNLHAVEPVLREDNPAGVTADMIAGLEFRTEDGTRHEARTVDEIYEALMMELDRGVAIGF